jgi:maleylpyruvate isomerase
MRRRIAYGATLNPVALRNLHHHAVVALNVEWRDLPADTWANRVRTIQGREVPVAETVWMRTREVWLHAVDLGNGGSLADFPPELVDQLLADVEANWRRRGVGDDLVLQPTDRPLPRGPEQGATVIHGTAAQLARWATGRGETDVTSSTGAVIRSPRWL